MAAHERTKPQKHAPAGFSPSMSGIAMALSPLYASDAENPLWFRSASAKLGWISGIYVGVLSIVLAEGTD